MTDPITLTLTAYDRLRLDAMAACLAVTPEYVAQSIVHDALERWLSAQVKDHDMATFAEAVR